MGISKFLMSLTPMAIKKDTEAIICKIDKFNSNHAKVERQLAAS